MKKSLLISLVCIAMWGALLWFRTHSVANPSWEQPAMSSSAHITLSGRFKADRLKALRRQIDAALEASKRQVSIWDPTTEISCFNRFDSTEPFPVSAEFARLVAFALEVSAQTGGAFDPTVKPLVDHWGFGPKAESAPLEEILKAVGWQKVRVENGALMKSHPRLQLDLSAIADGYGADCVADVIRAGGCTNFLVEVGGELVAEGRNPSGKRWRVGIDVPAPGRAPGEAIFQTLQLSGKALATSGDYRNFKRQADGTSTSHHIDPRTGRPAEFDVASVTVLADSCIKADAIGTALCVLGSQKGLEWVAAHPEFQALFIVHTTGQTFRTAATAGFPPAGP